jgi:hypothetical protein
MEVQAGPLSICAAEEVLCDLSCRLLVDDDAPVDAACVVVTNAKLVVCRPGQAYRAGSQLFVTPFERVSLHGRMPPDLNAAQPSLYLQIAPPASAATISNDGDPDDGWTLLPTAMELRIIPTGDNLAPDGQRRAESEAARAALLEMLADRFDMAYSATGGGDSDSDSEQDARHHTMFENGNDPDAPRPAIDLSPE